ncbi:serine/threonine-protein kinase [Persicimonas caeni]|nr:serine/threonine-protein kinase [Persicimonas caeni]
MPRVGDVLEGRYEIRQVLATGGMGVILRAKHLRMGREVAIKILHPHIAQEDHVVARFEREVRLAQMLNHPNTIRLYDFGEAENGLIYVVMELLEGADLKEVIAQEGPLPLGRAVEVTMQVLDGLGEAHEQDFVHRDLKPSNIFLTQDRRGQDQVKILDFGIAKSLEEGGSDLTATGSICGTAAYVAPEYLHDPTPQKAADVYAVGLILLEMLTGRRAFSGTTTAQTLMMQMQRHVQVPRRIAATPLGEVILRATHKEPAQRYQNADQMFEALEAIVDRLPADLRLRPTQVGELLRPQSGAFPGSKPPTAELPTHSPSHQQDSSSSLPQANQTPPTGEHSSPALGQPPAHDIENDATLVTPFPSPKSPTPEPELRAPNYIQDTMPGTAATDEKSKGKALWVVVAAVVLAAGAGAAYFATSSSDGEQAPIELGSQTAVEGEEAKAPAPEAIAVDDDEQAPALGEAGAEEGAEAENDEPVLPAPVEFSIESTPSGATVYAGDEPLGQTPLDHSFEPGALPMTLRFEKEGFETSSLEVTADSDKTQTVELAALPKPEPKPQVEKRPQRVNKPAPSTRQKPANKPKPKKEGEENVDEFLDEYL